MSFKILVEYANVSHILCLVSLCLVGKFICLDIGAVKITIFKRFSLHSSEQYCSGRDRYFFSYVRCVWMNG